jgi:hypothetical protein
MGDETAAKSLGITRRDLLGSGLGDSHRCPSGTPVTVPLHLLTFESRMASFSRNVTPSVIHLGAGAPLR